LVAASPILVAGALILAGPVASARAAPTGYSPTTIETAYGITPLLTRGIDGADELVVIPELFTPGAVSLNGNASDIRQDLTLFDRRFHLPDAMIQVDTSDAGSSAPDNANYEEVEDVEVFHAIAPKASIEVVLLPASVTASGGHFADAVVDTVQAAIGAKASAISMSASFGEHYVTSGNAATIHGALREARDHDITFVAASGDSGAASDNGPPREVSLPASDPLVLGVGGTTVTVSSSGAYVGEVAWRGPLVRARRGAASADSTVVRHIRTESAASPLCAACLTSQPAPITKRA
jgi:subtilase family serine protease